MSETFHILRRIQRGGDDVNVQTSSCTVLVILVSLMKLEFSRQNFKNSYISDLINICAVGAELFHTDGRTGHG